MRSTKKGPVNFGPQTEKFYWLTLSHPSAFFGETTFRPLGGGAVPYALEIDQALLAHTQMGMGSSLPPPKWPKIQRLVPIASGLVGVSSQPDA